MSPQTHLARKRRVAVATGTTLVLVLVLFVLTLMLGEQVASLKTVFSALFGNGEGGQTFVVRELRLPRATLGLLAGLAFGLAGITFQTMLRNPLAAPDIIGITSGASTFAVFAIIVLGLTDLWVSGFALAGGLITALAILGLSHGAGFAGFRMILIGIGFGAMFNAVTQWVLSKAASWDLQTAMRWLTGSLSGASWRGVLILGVTLVIFGGCLFYLRRDLDLLRLGDDTARGLGVHVTAVRAGLIISAVALLSAATATTGPIAFVSFMAGPIASRILGPGRPPLAMSALIGAALVLAADLIAQNLFAATYPVGVILGLVGAPFLIYLLVRVNKGEVRP